MFKKRHSKYSASVPEEQHRANEVNNDNNNKEPAPAKSQLVFHCQQAHGSPLGLISGYSNMRELYQKIAECCDFPAEDILYCTVNTQKVDMKLLLSGQIGHKDFIFAHRKGRPKEVVVVKTEDALGLTITDNGAGYSFIKGIREGSVVARIPDIEIGDHIEKLDGQNVVGQRHYEVAKLLKDIPKGTTFSIRLVGPMKNGFGSIAPKSSGARTGRKQAYGSRKETHGFIAKGQVTIDEPDDKAKAGIDKINNLLDSFMGIKDTELATQMWDLSAGKDNSMQLAEAINSSDLQEFGFTEEFIIELWGVITDARSGRIG